MRPVKMIVIHCTATPPGVAYSPATLEADHMARGFDRAGYHFYIRRSGEIVAMRPLGMIGAHAKGHNRFSVAVCYEGGLDADGQAADTRTGAQKESLTALLIYLLGQFPEAGICGHRDLSPDANYDGIISPDEWVKGCPGFDAAAAYEELIRSVRKKGCDSFTQHGK